MKYSIKDYKILGFEKSNAKNKKYTAYIQNIHTEKISKIHFGDNRYYHYNDKIGLYKHLNHNDKQRRENYRNRHKVYYDKNYYSPSYFSWGYLW